MRGRKEKTRAMMLPLTGASNSLALSSFLFFFLTPDVPEEEHETTKPKFTGYRRMD